MQNLKNKKLFLFDIDGTIAIGSKLIDGTLDLLKYIDKIGGKAIYITNNSTKSIESYITQFKNLWNIDTDESNFVTASYATLLYLKEHFSGKKIFVVGTKSLINELKSSGLVITEEVEDDIACVLVGFDNELNYAKIQKASEILCTRDVLYIATNPDLCCPMPFGSVPDCGAICKMLECAVKRMPLFIGKPNPEIVEACLKISGFSKAEAVVVGDRLYTDIACGINAGVDTIVVFTGEAKKEDMIATEYKATYEFENVRELVEKIGY